MNVDFSTINPVSQAELAGFVLVADTQFAEEMGSVSFNRKLLGIVQPGIHRGFDVEILGVDQIRVCPTGPNTAAVERDGQLITVQGQRFFDVFIPQSGDTAIVIQAISQHGLITNQVDKNSAVAAAEIKVIPLADVAPHHVIIVTIHRPAVYAPLHADHLSKALRKIGGVNNSPTFEQSDARYQLKGNYVTQAQLETAITEANSAATAEPGSDLPKSGSVIFDAPVNAQLVVAPDSSALDFLVLKGVVGTVRLLAPAGEKIKTHTGEFGSVVLGTPGGRFTFYRKGQKWCQF